jgi:hypothetical protein
MAFNTKIVPKQNGKFTTSYDPRNPKNLPTPSSGAVLGGIFHIGNGLFGSPKPVARPATNKVKF